MAPRPSSPSSEAKDLQPRIHYILPLEDRRCPEWLECGDPAGVEEPPAGVEEPPAGVDEPPPGLVVPRPSDPERRRFSASELISRLQLSQRKSSFTLKLGKSLSARITSRDRQPPRSLSPGGKSDATAACASFPACSGSLQCCVKNVHPVKYAAGYSAMYLRNADSHNSLTICPR